MTIKELKELIQDLPDNAEVAISDDGAPNDKVLFTCSTYDYDEYLNLLVLGNNDGFQYVK